MNWWAEVLKTILVAVTLLFLVNCDGASEPRVVDAALAPKPPQVTDAQRKERFVARPVATIPENTPKAWKRMMSEVDGRLFDAEYRQRTHVKDWRGSSELVLQFRLFGRDSEVDAHLLTALRKRKLPGLVQGLPRAVSELPPPVQLSVSSAHALLRFSAGTLDGFGPAKSLPGQGLRDVRPRRNPDAGGDRRAVSSALRPGRVRLRFQWLQQYTWGNS